MGALSFAADTLASLSSAFSPRNVSPTRVNLSNLVLEMDNDAHRIFNEFSTGMKMLYQYGSHNPCNITNITCQNLKLLHTNLKANNSFRNAIASIKENASATQNLTWLPLINDSNISANIVYLPAGTGISPNISGANLTMKQNELERIPFARDASTENARQLYLALLGHVKIEMNNRNSTPELLLKSGESFAEYFAHINIKRIAAIKNSSLILNIQLPA